MTVSERDVVSGRDDLKCREDLVCKIKKGVSRKACEAKGIFRVTIARPTARRQQRLSL
jgi:hypothetical protein